MKQLMTAHIDKFFILFLLSFIKVNSQEVIKDTIYFQFDNEYTLCDSVFTNLDYSEREKRSIESMLKTGTNGYIYFIVDSIFFNLKPKKVYSFKEFVEKREFYFDGRHNKIIDKSKFKKNLLNKYIIFIVKNGKYIKPKNITYNSYYPVRRGKTFLINEIKDTLYFKFDEKYIINSNMESNIYYLKDSSRDGTFFFEKSETKTNLKPHKILCLQDFIHSSEFYHKDFIRKLKDDELSSYLGNFIVFLVNKNEFIKVSSGVQHE